jgi:hypothetical protein
MGIISRQIGWSQESNLLWQILKQLNKLTSIMFGLKPKYKVYTALLTQTGGDNPLSINIGTLTIGVTYFIDEVFENSGADFFNVGAPNNNVGTFFIATGTTPNSWGELGSETTLIYNQGAPVVTVLENTIGNIWFTYVGVGRYSVNSDGLFTTDKVFSSIYSQPIDAVSDGIKFALIQYQYPTINSITIATGRLEIDDLDDFLTNTPIEIRVYN